MNKIYFLLISLLLGCNSFSQDLNSFLDNANTFFIKNVVDGKVNYEGVKESKELDELVKVISTFQFSSLKENDQKAYLINTYNLLVIDKIRENWPVPSPMDISGFFDGVKHNIAGKKWTLNHLENEYLRPNYKDPRLHFVLVCGAKDCPPIINEAYYPATLELQLEEQTKAALNDPSFIKVEGESIKLSEIFKWYASDFKLKAKNEIEYINLYRESKIESKAKYNYYNYDWSVNSQVKEANNEIGGTGENQSSEFNLQTYNAGSLLKKGKFDVSLFNSIYTQSKSQWMGDTFDGFRETFYSSLLQFTYGTTKSARINLGLDIKFAGSGRSSIDDFSKVSRAFEFKNDDSTRIGLSYVGPRIKIQPFKSEPNFTMQSSILLPTTSFSEGRGADENGLGGLYFLDWNRVQWWTQFFYVKNLRKSQLFLEGDVWYRIGYQENQASAVDIPLTIIYSYFPSPKTTIYGLASHVIRNQYNPNSYDDGITTAANYTAAGLGFKYQVSSKLNLELLYTNFLRGTNSGLGNTFNLGLRYVH